MQSQKDNNYGQLRGATAAAQLHTVVAPVSNSSPTMRSAAVRILALGMGEALPSLSFNSSLRRNAG